jgi:hypothetical protein
VRDRASYPFNRLLRERRDHEVLAEHAKERIVPGERTTVSVPHALKAAFHSGVAEGIRIALEVLEDY